MKKKKNKSAPLPTDEKVAESDSAPSPEDQKVADTDTRPTSSPYVGNYVDVYFRGGGTPCKVPKVLLKEYSKLHGLCNGWDDTYSLHLNEISWDVGHSVVHFLYTRTYQILQSIGTTALERDIAEFTTHILVYVAAREYGLLGLEESARGGIEKLGENLEMPTIIKAAKHAYPNPNTDDKWFIEYLKSRSRALLTNQTTIDFRTTTTGTMSVVEIVLQGLVQSLGASHDPLETSGPIIAEGAENASDFDTSLTKCVFTPSADSGDTGSLRTSTDGKPEETLPAAELLVSTPGPTTEALGGEGDIALEDDFIVASKKKRKGKKGTIDPSASYESEEDCEFMKEHMSSEGWADCRSCNEHLRRLARSYK